MKSKALTILVLFAFINQECSLYGDQFITQDNKIDSTLILNSEQPDIQIILDWESYSDLDLYVQDPAGEWIWYKHRKSQSNGILDKDDRTGNELEKVEWSFKKASSGYYNIYIKHNGGSDTNYKVQIKAFGNTKQFLGTIKSNQKLYITTFSESNLETNLHAESLQIPELRKN